MLESNLFLLMISLSYLWKMDPYWYWDLTDQDCNHDDDDDDNDDDDALNRQSFSFTSMATKIQWLLCMPNFYPSEFHDFGLVTEILPGFHQNSPNENCRLLCLGRIEAIWSPPSLWHLASEGVMQSPYCHEYRGKGISFWTIVSWFNQGLLGGK